MQSLRRSQALAFEACLGIDRIQYFDIGGDCPGKTELDPALLRRARVFVEYLAQSRIEGEIQSLRPASDAVEIWQVVAGNAPGRLSDADVTIFDSVGFALADFSALRYTLDPKDLYGYMQTLQLQASLR